MRGCAPLREEDTGPIDLDLLAVLMGPPYMGGCGRLVGVCTILTMESLPRGVGFSITHLRLQTFAHKQWENLGPAHP